MGAIDTWGGLGGVIKYGIDYNKSGISRFTPDADEAARITSADPEASEAIENNEINADKAILCFLCLNIFSMSSGNLLIYVLLLNGSSHYYTYSLST